MHRRAEPWCQVLHRGAVLHATCWQRPATMDDDEMLRLALEASAAEHQSQHTDLVIGTSVSTPRASIARPDYPDAPVGGPADGS